MVKSIADSSKHGDILRRHLDYSERYGKAVVKFLSDGRVRYCREIDLARRPSEMIGRRYVHEFNAVSGKSRGWHETLNHTHNIR